MIFNFKFNLYLQILIYFIKAGTVMQMNIESVYESIADHFDSTRYNKWKGVMEFLQTIEPATKLLDAGCGNGKYLSVRKDCEVHACDTCPTLIDIATKKHVDAHIIVANIKSLPYKDNAFDAIICIAVLHHLTNDESRLTALTSLLRVLKPGGKLFLTVWATEARKPKWRSCDESSNDYMVPWNHINGTIYERFYHLFCQEEIVNLIQRVPLAKIESTQFEKNNWQVTIRKEYRA
jgi:ubiquinone/menaquinone biosynthesis C-methylase UbiE